MTMISANREALFRVARRAYRGAVEVMGESAMIDDVLYREEILDHADYSPYRGRLESPDRSVELDNPLCGDRLRVELSFGPGGRIDRMRFEGHGCVISQAAASLLSERIEGRTVDEARRFSPDDLLRLFGITLTPTRRKCGLLAWRVLQHALAEPAPALAAHPAPRLG